VILGKQPMPRSYSAMTKDSDNTGFSKAIVDEKNERIARSSLNDMVVFQKSVDEELVQLTEEKKQGSPVDEDLVQKMTTVKGQFQSVLAGFSNLDDDSQRHALTGYADAVQDLITHLYRQGK